VDYTFKNITHHLQKHCLSPSKTLPITFKNITYLARTLFKSSGYKTEKGFKKKDLKKDLKNLTAALWIKRRHEKKHQNKQ
jgi:5-methylthioribose kinase